MRKAHSEIIVRKSKKNIMTFFVSLYLIGLAIVGVSIFIEFRNFLTAILCIILILVGVHGLRLFLWLIIGKEKIMVNNNEQEQGFDGFKGLVTKMSYKMPYVKILNKGRIGIKYGDKQYRILYGLSVHEGKKNIH